MEDLDLSFLRGGFGYGFDHFKFANPPLTKLMIFEKVGFDMGIFKPPDLDWKI